MSPAHDTDNVERTSIQISEELTDESYEQKHRGDSCDNVIWRLLEPTDNHS
ncbi:hypothetical protein [Haloquadratum walsbyi]|jgi:hypothetical protein|uniref:Uncharacterized protein n=1 Tax=Haloquadratum walsbyi J07HQW2 TaxID=1238425 RepID=U1N285_9EURY|nr:hypothetical protein [Haloquadratum walsbyi]ERG96974.1 MAG: hypothetical protein J07HQW2_03460 [Haloquadratum walsbyi J07HQW2]